MQGVPRTWCVSFELNSLLELHLARVELIEADGRREVIRMITGPFDSPDDILSTLLELIEHAEWSGEQLSFERTSA